MSDRILTLRSRRGHEGLEAGMLIGSPTGKAVYRVLEVTLVRRAGEIQSPRLRIICRRLRAGEAPHGVEVRPWPKDAAAPRKPSRPPPGPATKVPPLGMGLAIAASRRSERRRKPHQHHYGATDVGPTLRLELVSDGQGGIIREPDVAVETVRDPAKPAVVIRRAVRADPLLALLRARSISAREFEAAELLRSSLESLTPPLGQTGGMAVQTSPFLRSISVTSLEACCAAREASAALGRLYWEAVLWVCLGGTVTGYAVYRRMRLAAAGERVRAGMTRLADHFEGATSCVR
jgi:hypothetical protein